MIKRVTLGKRDLQVLKRFWKWWWKTNTSWANLLKILTRKCSLSHSKGNLWLGKNQTLEVRRMLPWIWLWGKLITFLPKSRLLQKHLTENSQDVFSQKDLKEFYQQSLDISRTVEYRGRLNECFQTPENTLLKPAEISIDFDIVIGVFHNTLHIVRESVRVKSRDDMVSTFYVKQMDDVGKGKVRFVAAWAVSRVLQRAKKYLRDNLYTSSAVWSLVNNCLHKIELIESIVVIPCGILCSETKHPGTLEVTESRQYKTHGLIHVSDQFFEFALELEQKRMNGLNSRMLKKYIDKLVEVVEAGLLNDQEQYDYFSLPTFSFISILFNCSIQLSVKSLFQ